MDNHPILKPVHPTPKRQELGIVNNYWLLEWDDKGLDGWANNSCPAPLPVKCVKYSCS